MQIVKPKVSQDHACKEVLSDFCDTANWLVQDDVSPKQLRMMLLMLEKRKLTRFGLRMESVISAENTLKCNLRHVKSGDLCASVDIDTVSGEISAQSACI